MMPNSTIEQLKELVPEVGRQIAQAPVTEVCCAALDELSVGVIIVDSKGHVYVVNKSAEVMFGYDRSELYGQDVSILVPDALRVSHTKLVGSYFADPKTVMHQRAVGSRDNLFGRRKDGSLFPITVDLSPFTTNIGLFAAATVKGKVDART